MSQTQTNISNQLLDLSHTLGNPARDWAILGEGNTSAASGKDVFLVKASGPHLGTLTANQLAAVRFEPLLAVIEGTEALPDGAVKDLLLAACTTENSPMPSVETLLHAYLLTLDGVEFVGHTHVASIGGVVCSERGWAVLAAGHRLFPDEVVVCGIAPCCVPYTDPGLPLARVLRREVQQYMGRYGLPPKTIYLQNHGFIALASTPSEVVQITQMADKAAQILTAAFACGSPTFLSPAAVERILTRPDEHFRRKALGLA